MIWQVDMVAVEALPDAVAGGQPGVPGGVLQPAEPHEFPGANGNRSSNAFGTITATYDPRIIQFGRARELLNQGARFALAEGERPSASLGWAASPRGEGALGYATGASVGRFRRWKVLGRPSLESPKTQDSRLNSSRPKPPNLQAPVR